MTGPAGVAVRTSPACAWCGETRPKTHLAVVLYRSYTGSWAVGYQWHWGWGTPFRWSGMSPSNTRYFGSDEPRARAAATRAATRYDCALTDLTQHDRITIPRPSANPADKPDRNAQEHP